MDDDHAIVGFDELLRLQGEPVPRVANVAERAEQALVAVVARGVEHPARLVDVHLRIAELGEVGGAAAEGRQVPEQALVSTLYDLHVLRRHQPRSISRACEPYVASPAARPASSSSR